MQMRDVKTAMRFRGRQKGTKAMPETDEVEALPQPHADFVILHQQISNNVAIIVRSS